MRATRTLFLALAFTMGCEPATEPWPATMHPAQTQVPTTVDVQGRKSNADVRSCGFGASARGKRLRIHSDRNKSDTFGLHHRFTKTRIRQASRPTIGVAESWQRCRTFRTSCYGRGYHHPHSSAWPRWHRGLPSATDRAPASDDSSAGAELSRYGPHGYLALLDSVRQGACGHFAICRPRIVFLGPPRHNAGDRRAEKGSGRDPGSHVRLITEGPFARLRFAVRTPLVAVLRFARRLPIWILRPGRTRTDCEAGDMLRVSARPWRGGRGPRSARTCARCCEDAGSRFYA